jgi:hypothetical protein
MFDSMFWPHCGFCFCFSISYCFMNVSRGSKMLQDRRLGFTRGTRIMYKKEYFVFHLFSMQSIIYLYNLTFIHLICPLSEWDHRTPEPSSKPPQNIRELQTRKQENHSLERRGSTTETLCIPVSIACASELRRGLSPRAKPELQSSTRETLRCLPTVSVWKYGSWHPANLARI